MTEKEFMQLKLEESKEIDLKGIFVRYLRYWYWFVLSLAFALGAAFLYLKYYAIPQYVIQSKVLIKDDKKGVDNLGGAFKDLEMFQSSKIVDNEVEVINAVTLMQRVLTELEMNTSYYKQGLVKEAEIYGEDLPIKVLVKKLNADAYGRSLSLHVRNNNSFELHEEVAGSIEKSLYKFGQEIQKPYGIFTVVAATGAMPAKDAEEIIVKFNDLNELAGAYSSKLSIEPANKNSSVLFISFKDPVPEKGKNIINKLVEVYNREAVEDKNLTAASTIEFIDERLAYLTAELSDVEKGVALYKRQNNLTDVSSDAQVYVQRASEYNKNLAEYEIQLDVLSSIEKYLNEKGQQYQLVPSSLSIQDATLLGLISKFNELQLERERMLRTTQPTNLLVQNVNDQLANLKLNILENIKNIKKGLTITKNNLKASTAQFETKIQKVPGIERELLEIQRQQGIKQGLYLYLLQKREEAGVSLAAAVSNSRVLDPAIASGPVDPKPTLVYLIALMIGLGVPFICVFVSFILDDKVQEIKDIENVTQTPIVGEICRATTTKTLVVSKNKREPIVELFSLVRANLQFATVGKENKVIMVSSSMSGEGKTFFSINLAASMVIAGKKVVVVGFDLREPKLMQSLGLPNKVGISDYLITEELNLHKITHPVESLPGLFVIGSGPVPPNPAELLSSARVSQLIEELKDNYDHIIIDTPPVGQVADAFALAPFADSSIYLIRYRYTFKSQIKIVDDIYKNKKFKSPVIVLNDAKKNNGYGYGYGYGEKKSNKKVEVVA